MTTVVFHTLRSTDLEKKKVQKYVDLGILFADERSDDVVGKMQYFLSLRKTFI